MSSADELYVEAVKASRLLKLHAIVTVATAIAYSVCLLVFSSQAFNVLALSQLTPIKRAGFIASSLAAGQAYGLFANGVGLALAWVFLGLGLLAAWRVVGGPGYMRYLSMGIGILGIIMGVLMAASAQWVYEDVYRAVLSALNKPEMRAILVSFSMQNAQQALLKISAAIKEAMAALRPVPLVYAASAIAPIVAALAAVCLEPVARRTGSMVVRAFQVLLFIYVLNSVLGLLRISLGVASIIVSILLWGEPITAWLTANRITAYASSILINTSSSFSQDTGQVGEVGGTE
ncbi:MAG: hypothetical protein GXO09_06280 [Crenarchaeota archaeon]|nr:hypothetical protein [Thermoproteota archaeon]